MALLVWDEKTYRIYVRVRPEEVYAPTEEVQALVSEAECISEEYNALTEKLTKLFSKCQDWNLANDEIYAKNFKANQDKMKALKSLKKT